MTGDGKKADDINANCIMDKVRANIKKMNSSDSNDKNDVFINQLANLKELSYILNNSYQITSHHMVLGPVLVRGRNLVNSEVKRYVDPTIQKQTAFNENTVNVLEDTGIRLQELERSNLSLESVITNDIQSRLSNLEKLAENAKNTPWSVFYDRKWGESDLQNIISYHEEFIALIKEYASKAAGGLVPKLLEVGLGTASFSIYLSRYSYHCVGIDNDSQIVRKSVETNNKLGGFAKFFMMDASDLDMFKDKLFDVTFSQGTMEHFDNKTLADLLMKQLKVSKYVMFSVPSLYYEFREYGNERKMSTGDWERLLTDAGFKVSLVKYYKENKQIVCIITD